MNRAISVNRIGNSRRKRAISSRLIWFIILLGLLMVPTNGKGIPPYLFIPVLSVPFLLKYFGLKQLKLSNQNLYLVYYAAVYVGSVLIHFYSGSIILAVSFLSYFAVSPVIVNHALKTKHDFEIAVSVIVAVFAAYSVLGIMECLTGINLFDIIFGRSGDAIWSGVNYNRYGFRLSYGFLVIMHNNATMMCMIWAIAAYQLCNAHSHKLFWFVCWALIGTYDIIMMSRMIMLTAPALQLIIFRKKGTKWLTKRVFILALAGLILALIFGSDLFASAWNIVGGMLAPIIDEFFGTSFKSQFHSTLSGSGQRFVLWNWIFNAVKGKIIFGIGFTDKWSRTVTGHNFLGQTWQVKKTSIEVQWLRTLYQTGLFGLSGFIVFQFGSIKRTWIEKVDCYEKKVTFQYVMKWLTIFYYIHLFAIAAAQELHIYYFLLAMYTSYINICRRGKRSRAVKKRDYVRPPEGRRETNGKNH